MIERLLPTKLAMPRPSRWRIHRPRLASLLDGSLDARLVLLSAPPGFGKTTALVDWLDGSPVRSAWIALDATDNDAVRFLRYLGAAVASLVGQEARGDVLLPVASGDVLAVVEELAAWLAARPEPMVLGLDDYHLITDATVEEAVAALVERLPPQAHVAISTRADPALPLARLRARGELLEVRADALRFTNDEASAFFLERIGPVLGPADVDALVARTEGWPAVLQLVSATLAGRTDVAARVRDFTATHRFVLDYVVEEVLADLPPETEGFLLRTSILERLCGPLCDAVTGVPEGRERLEALERANLLVIRSTRNGAGIAITHCSPRSSGLGSGCATPARCRRSTRAPPRGTWRTSMTTRPSPTHSRRGTSRPAARSSLTRRCVDSMPARSARCAPGSTRCHPRPSGDTRS